MIKNVIYPKLQYSLLYGIGVGFVIASFVIVLFTNSDRFFFNGAIGINNDYFYVVALIIVLPLSGFLFVRNRRIEVFEKEIHVRQKLFSNEVTKIVIDDIIELNYYDYDRDKRSAYKIHILTETEIVYIAVKPYKKIALAKLGMDLKGINSSIEFDELYKDIIGTHLKIKP